MTNEEIARVARMAADGTKVKVVKTDGNGNVTFCNWEDLFKDCELWPLMDTSKPAQTQEAPEIKMHTYSKTTPPIREKMYQMYMKGSPYWEIMKETGFSEGTVRDAIKQIDLEKKAKKQKETRI